MAGISNSTDFHFHVKIFVDFHDFFVAFFLTHEFQWIKKNSNPKSAKTFLQQFTKKLNYTVKILWFLKEISATKYLQDSFYLACAYQAHAWFSSLSTSTFSHRFAFNLFGRVLLEIFVFKVLFINWLFWRSANYTSVILQVLKNSLIRSNDVDIRVPVIEQH